MDEKQKIDYRSLILGALLHDVGKFTIKQFQKSTHKHPWYSEEFIENNLSYIKDRNWVNFELVKLFAKRHHEYTKWKDEYLVQQITDEHNRKLAYIASRADNASSRERSDRRYDESFINREAQRFPLDAIFGEVSLQGKDFYDKDWFNYYKEISPLSPEKAFPKRVEKNKALLNQADYKEHYKDFVAKVKSIELDLSFDKFYITLLSLLERYCWCIPSATNEKLSDISLYDHLKTTSAFAACIYQYHLENRFDETLIKKPGSYKLLLLGGDLAGIQNYIYQLKGTTKLTKRLRARSFHITILVESIIHWILNKFSLPISCCLTNGGGKFLLVLPNTEHVKKELENISKDISDNLYKRFFGEIALNLTWQSEDETKDIQLTEFGFKVYDFFKHAEKIYDQLEKEKYKKFRRLISKGTAWNTERFFMDKEIWGKFGEKKKVCQICGKFPAEFSKTRGNNTIETCNLCNQDECIGTRLPRTGFISFSNNKINDCSFHIFDNIHATLWGKNDTSWKKSNPEFYMVKILPAKTNTAATTDENLLPGVYYTFLANHVPIVQNAQSFKAKYEKWLDEEGKDISNGEPYSFSALATLSMDADKSKGSRLLGVLKADIDRLGLIFGRGFKAIGKEGTKRRIELDGRIIPLDRVTPSRYLTMSRMIELFFSGWIHQRLSNNTDNLPIEKDFSKIYTVYSGGDDLLLVGPWETIIYFADELYRKFREFTCKNEDITLSAGIAIVKPKLPVSKWAYIVNELIERSKNAGRDRLTIFDTTIKWKELGDLIDFMNTLHENMEGNKSNSEDIGDKKSVITMGFLYRLLRYNRLYRSVIEHGDVRNLVYHSQMAYDIQRTIVREYLAGIEPDKKEEAKEEFMKDKLYTKLIQLFKLKDEGKNALQDGIKNRLMENLRIPVMWTIYKNRG
jgi:CRISPR-associated protein Csm1